MRFYRNIELTRLHAVSDKAVRNWIEGALKGKNNLELVPIEQKHYIANNLHNNLVIEDLVAAGRKYQNQLSHKKISPSSKFYELYNQDQVADICNNLEKYHEFPFQYRYVEEGGQHWDNYLERLHQTGRRNVLTGTINLLKLDEAALNSYLAEFDSCNIIDLGVGNGLAVKELLQRLGNKVNSYIGIDISPYMLSVTNRNLSEWFGDKLNIHTYQRDVSKQEFGDILARHSTPSTVNVICLFGGIIGNFKEPLRALTNIRESIGVNDVLLSTDQLDNKNSRNSFDFSTATDKAELSLHNRFALELLGFKENMYDAEQFFDPIQNARFIQVRLKYTVSLYVQVCNMPKQIDFRKGNTILLLRMWEWDENRLASMYVTSGFKQQRILCSEDQTYILLVSRVNNGKAWAPGGATT